MNAFRWGRPHVVLTLAELRDAVTALITQAESLGHTPGTVYVITAENNGMTLGLRVNPLDDGSFTVDMQAV